MWRKIFSEKMIMVYGVILVGLVYFFSNDKPNYYYDYTYRMAEALIQGRLGLIEEPPRWLNEMLKVGNEYYSVFPLGSVLTMIPLAILKLVGIISRFPSQIVDSVIAAFIFLYFFLLSYVRELDLQKRILFAAFPVLGTCLWTNLSFGGAWQIALGFALLGQAAALYYILVKKNIIAAGIFFALAFGNRTEVVLTLPLFLYLIFMSRELKEKFDIMLYAKFLFVPVVLLIVTLFYNYARFSSFLDFGYAGYMKLPGIAEEYGYRNGFFSIYAIPLNFYYMLVRSGWNFIYQFPYIVPDGFGGSILLSSPFLFLLFRENLLSNKIARVSWIVIFILCLALWVHGNPGGWQFSYRYAIIILPWFFLIILLNGPKKLTYAEIILFTISVSANAYATYLFNWTKLVNP